jgi:hypothetical protein
MPRFYDPNRPLPPEFDPEDSDWRALSDAMAADISRSSVSPTSAISAGLRAIIDNLTDDMTLEEAKRLIASSLGQFREEK